MFFNIFLVYLLNHQINGLKEFFSFLWNTLHALTRVRYAQIYFLTLNLYLIMKKRMLLSFFAGLGLSFALTACNHNDTPVPESPPVPTITEADSLALLDFYHAMKGEEWEKKWDLKDPNTWYNVGFKLVNNLKVVQTLQINKYCCVEGSVLPQSLNQLQYMESFVIYDVNGLNCSIPETLYECPSLRNIVISNVPLLKGPLSPKISNLAATLINLTLISCKNFVSKLPPEIGLCQHLRYLNLANNSFYGKIPYEICHLSTNPFFGQNHFSEIDWRIFTDPETDIFPMMDRNDFTGVIPQEVLDSKDWERISSHLYPFNPGFGFSNYEKPDS